ncbi:hypothetical protein [Lysinibacillus sp. G4S2]|uniref:hypothetical protein n=1 Tax=Lysinibacillus sp. G4S2 TaxID=3055859 RepID=UPI0025A1D8B7|nr:hypothetical protein [Lysinibacillus sp. G4S2]MDM5249464.1 hypothetical protein [Lysinibacillus sp. G4S2]
MFSVRKRSGKNNKCFLCESGAAKTTADEVARRLKMPIADKILRIADKYMIIADKMPRIADNYTKIWKSPPRYDDGIFFI